MRLVVIGGGPAGMEAAKVAALHADVTVVSVDPVGRWQPLSIWVWMAAAAAGERNTATIAGRAARAMEAWQERSAAELATLGVQVLVGRARLGGPGEVLVDTGDSVPRSLVADAVIVAADAPDAYPAGVIPDGERILTDVHLTALTSLPGSVLVPGDGPASFELCHLLSQLGVAVTWLVPEGVPRTRIAPEVDGYLTRLLESQGVQVVPYAPVLEVTRAEQGVCATVASGAELQAEMVVLAAGRRLAPETLGLSMEETVTDIYGQTARRGVYLVGDAFAPHAISIAMAQARAAALHAVGRSSAPADTRHIVLAFMHHPQVAKVGQLTSDGAHGSVTVALEECVAAYARSEINGFLTLAWDRSSRLAGALAVAPGAAEILAPVALAMRAGLRLDELAATYGPHPSLGELVALAARKAEHTPPPGRP